MPSIPNVNNSSGSVKQGGISGFTAFGPSGGISGAGAMSVLGKGLSDAGRGFASASVDINTSLKRNAADKASKDAAYADLQEKDRLAFKGQEDVREVNEKYSKLRLDWAKRQNEYDHNPSEDQLKVSIEEYDKYVEDLLRGSTNDEVRNALQERADSYKIGVAEKNHKLGYVKKSTNFAVGFDQMFVDANDAIFTTKSIEELFEQQDLLSTYVEQAVATGRVQSESTIAALNTKIGQLPVSWADSIMGIDPQAVIEAVATDAFSEVPPNIRQGLIDKAKRVISAGEEFDKQAIQQSFESDRAQLLTTGVGNAFDYDIAKKAFGKTKADQMQRQLDDAESVYGITQKTIGADGAALGTIIKESKPKSDPSSTTYAEELAYHNAVKDIVIKTQERKIDDPFSFFAQEPSIAAAIEEAANSPDNPEVQRGLREMILSKQKSDKSLSPWNYAIMPKAEAADFIEEFNSLLAVGVEGDTQGVREQLLSFEDEFRNHTDIALSQLSRVNGGEKITGKLNPLMWHTNNPSVFRLALDSIRKNNDEVMKLFSAEERSDLLIDVSSDSNLLQYSQSIVATNNSAEAFNQVKGVRETFQAFTRDWVLSGGAVDESSEAFFGSYYSFGETNGMSYSRPLQYKDAAGVDQVMSQEQVSLSDEWLDVEIQDIILNQEKGTPKFDFDPATLIPQHELFTPAEVQEDISDALESNAFWGTTQDENGVYLYVKGSLPGTSVMVKTKSGEPVMIPFHQTVGGRNRIGRDFLSGEIKETGARTDDAWYDKVGRTLSRL